MRYEVRRLQEENSEQFFDIGDCYDARRKNAQRARKARQELANLKRRTSNAERELADAQERLLESRQQERVTREECEVLKHIIKVNSEHVAFLEARAQAANAIETARKTFAADATAAGQMNRIGQ